MQNGLAGVEPPQPGIVARIDHPVDRTDAHLPLQRPAVARRGRCRGPVSSVCAIPPANQVRFEARSGWIGDGIASVWSQDFDRHSPLVGDGANQVSSLAINVLDHQQGGGHSSR